MRRLTEFMSEFNDGFQKANRFECQLYAPEGIAETSLFDFLVPVIASRQNPKFSATKVKHWLAQGLICESAQLPSRSHSTTKLEMYGIGEHIPYHTEYLDLSCTFRMPFEKSDNGVPRFFHYWMNYIVNHENGMESGADYRFPQEYYGTLLLSLLDNRKYPSITYEFHNVFPKTIESTPLSWGADGFLTYSVSFAYSYYKILPYQAPPIIDILTPFGDIGLDVRFADNS